MNEQSIDSEVKYYCSNKYILKQVVILFLLIAVLFLVVYYFDLIIALVFGIFTTILYSNYLEPKKIESWKKKTPQLILNSEGINVVTNQLGLVDWDEATNLSVDSKGILTFAYHDKNLKLFHVIFNNLNDFGISDYDEFQRIIDVYKKRHRLKNLL